MAIASSITAALLPSLIAGGATAYGAKKQGQSADRAARVTDQSNRDALAFERQREAQLQRQWEAEQEFQERKWNITEEDRLYNRGLSEARETQRVPYRQAGLSSLARLDSLMSPAGHSQRRSPSSAGRLGDLARR